MKPLGICLLTIFVFMVLVTVLFICLFRKPSFEDTPSYVTVCNPHCVFQNDPWKSHIDFEHLCEKSTDEPKHSFIEDLPESILERLQSLSFKNFSEDCPSRRLSTLKTLKLSSIEEIQKHNQQVLKDIDPNAPEMSGVIYLDKNSLQTLLGQKGMTDLQTRIGSLTKFHLFKLWINTKGYTTPLHSDNVRNVVLQLSGSKRWVIASRRYEKDAYFAYKNKFGNIFYKVKNPYNPDLSLYPKFKKVKLLDFDMTKGDILYLPKNYIHFVHSNDCSVMLSFIFK